MVKIAIAGGSGAVAQEVIDALAATNKHKILLLSRKDASASAESTNTTWVKADYTDKEQLTKILSGVDTVLSFITVHTDHENQSQKNLIDASIAAGVRRFAPSEWVTTKLDHMGWYNGKLEIREYLRAVNQKSKVLEYSLFQPGLFVNYFTYPHRSSKHVDPIPTQIDFHGKRAIVTEGYENVPITLTTISDMTNIVVKAVEYEGVWPVDGGIRGSDFTLGQLVRLGEKIRGGSFTLDILKIDDLKAGEIKSTWKPEVTHSSIPPEQAEAMSTFFLTGLTLGLASGAFEVSNGWNKQFPDYKFIDANHFLTEAWANKP